MDKYYYFIASLPYLEFDKTPLITKEEFMDECAKWLSEKDVKRVESVGRVTLGEFPEDTEVLREWKAFDLELKKEIAIGRKKGQENAGKKVTERVKAIFKLDTPLLAEKAIEKKRWEFIENKVGKYHFDINAVMFYFLKLGIAQRLAE
ncbi:MAG: DUF2764 family protein, partial [Candidatus Omnitrophica bacterium]|nr:DUF2764 family protein [Candidatus Omnitrophota bacterium]